MLFKYVCHYCCCCCWGSIVLNQQQQQFSGLSVFRLLLLCCCWSAQFTAFAFFAPDLVVDCNTLVVVIPPLISGGGGRLVCLSNDKFSAVGLPIPLHLHLHLLLLRSSVCKKVDDLIVVCYNNYYCSTPTNNLMTGREHPTARNEPASNCICLRNARIDAS